MDQYDYYSYSSCNNFTFCNNINQTVSLPVLGDSSVNNNVGLSSSSGYDLALHPGWTSADPGFQKEYWVMPYNQSIAPAPAPITVVFNYDPNLIYQYSLAPLPVVDTVGHTLTWTMNTVPSPYYDWDNFRFQNFFMVPASLSLNYQLQSDFRITPVSGDCDSSNNHYHYSETVIGSHDPNAKTVSPAGPVTAEDSILTYTIYFQNTGSDSTHFVIIKDTLSPNLDPASVRNIASSDKYSSFNVSGKGVLTWTFNPLRIVDSATNPAGSKRFIMFTVKKKAGLSIGSTISNTAFVYFDYNTAVVTNTVIDTESLPLHIFEISNIADITVKAFPNPFNDYTHIVVTGINEKFGFELYDATGRLQQSIPSVDNNQFEVHKGELSDGVYMYRILVAGKPAAYGKLVVE
jgi:fimbrial isopeptide formation D2 family protein